MWCHTVVLCHNMGCGGSKFGYFPPGPEGDWNRSLWGRWPDGGRTQHDEGRTDVGRIGNHRDVFESDPLRIVGGKREAANMIVIEGEEVQVAVLRNLIFRFFGQNNVVFFC